MQHSRMMPTKAHGDVCKGASGQPTREMDGDRARPAIFQFAAHTTKIVRGYAIAPCNQRLDCKDGWMVRAFAPERPPRLVVRGVSRCRSRFTCVIDQQYSQ